MRATHEKHGQCEVRNCNQNGSHFTPHWNAPFFSAVGTMTTGLYIRGTVLQFPRGEGDFSLWPALGPTPPSIQWVPVTFYPR